LNQNKNNEDPLIIQDENNNKKDTKIKVKKAQSGTTSKSDFEKGEQDFNKNIIKQSKRKKSIKENNSLKEENNIKPIKIEIKNGLTNKDLNKKNSKKSVNNKNDNVQEDSKIKMSDKTEENKDNGHHLQVQKEEILSLKVTKISENRNNSATKNKSKIKFQQENNNTSILSFFNQGNNSTKNLNSINISSKNVSENEK